ncbi:cation transporter [Streptococcus ferus]|uniref:Co/Zn/Cd cation transporter n=1 Tax=Streptococcus ferus TaxID=1345 RepID=A0A2X3W628_9STRE|nr:cation transporter [Streptococcus ferus]SQF39203.1 Co/Zn/Cd cation transporter [Streptococcus ferus]
MNQKYIEIKSLIVSSIMNFIIGIAGVVVYIITDLNFLLLDSAISLIAFISSLVAYYISKNSHKKTEVFPKGLYFLEPMYALFRSLVTVGVLLITLLETSASAFAYLVNGEGYPIETGIVLPYSFVMVFLCYGLYFYNHTMNKKIGNMSIIIEAESKGNFIDGTISLGIAIAMTALYVVDINGPLGFLHYTGDFFITVILVAFSISEPIKSLIASFHELNHSVIQDEELETMIINVIENRLPNHHEDFDIHILKQGTHIRIHLMITRNTQLFSIEELVSLKRELIERLAEEFASLDLSFVI